MNRSRDESSSSSVSVASSNGGKSKRSKSLPNAKRPNPNTVEKVKMIMEQEGRSARNLVSWSIPLDSYGNSKGKSTKKSMNMSRKQLQVREELEANSRIPNPRYHSGDNSGNKKPVNNNSDRRSAGGTRKPMNIRARYWAYLFENLRRAVDEIYATCEGDASVVECKEVLLILDNYHHEFKALIDWLHLQERLENTDLHNRPQSLAWEVRKSSPGRPRQMMMSKGVASGTSPNSTGGKISRCLRFSSSPDVAALATASAMYRSLTGRAAPPAVQLLNVPTSEKAAPTCEKTTTWADRVKGIKPQSAPVPHNPVNTPPMPKRKNLPEDEDKIVTDLDNSGSEPGQLTLSTDGEGWETVKSKNKQPKHTKNFRNSSDSKQGDSGYKADTATAPPTACFGGAASSSPQGISTPSCAVKLSDVKPEPASPSSLSTSNSFVNIVVDRIIGMEGMGSVPPSGTSTGSADQVHHDTGSSKVVKMVKFEDTTSKKHIDVKETKGYSDEEEKASDVIELTNGDTMEENNLILKKLVEEEELLALTLHAEHDASIAVAEQRERDLLRQIQEAKDQESPELDADCDSARSSAGAKELPLLDQPPQQPLEWADFVARFEAEQAAAGGLSWSDLVEEEELREPGRAVHMHEKLSSPSRKRTPAEARRKLEEKHRRAEERRQQMHQERTQKIHELTEKVHEVITWKNDLINRQRDLLQSCHVEKLARAEEQRAMQLLTIKKKAQAEDIKVNEIAFINELQEQNKRHEVLMRIEEHESRIQELEQERSRMQEMKSSKEESVKERRRALEKERQDRIEELKVKRNQQTARIEQQKIEKEKEREKLAKERARDREMRLSALNAAQQEAVTELQKKIQLKHNESERRHQVQLEQRKEKALELSLGRFSSLNSSLNATSFASQASAASAGGSVPSKSGAGSGYGLTDTRINIGDERSADDKCSSSSDATPSPRNAAYGDEDANELGAQLEERRKAVKKKLKKLRSRMSTRAQEFLKQVENTNNSAVGTNKSRIVRLIKDANKIVANQKGCSGPWPTNSVSAFDRALGEMTRKLEKQSPDHLSFRAGGGFAMLDGLFSSILKEKESKDISILPDKTLSNGALLFRNACRDCYDNCVYALYSGKMTSLIDLTLIQVSKKTPSDQALSRKTSSRKKNEADVVFDVASPSLLSALSVVFDELNHQPPSSESSKLISMVTVTLTNTVLTAYLNRGLDVISYIVTSGIIEILSGYFKSIRHEVAPGSNMSGFLENGLALLESLTTFMSTRNRLLIGRAKPVKAKKHLSPANLLQHCDSDPTRLLATLQQTDIMGIVSVLYGLLLHGAPERPTTLRSTSAKSIPMTSAEAKPIPNHTLNFALAVMSVLNAVAEMDLILLQATLAAEGVSPAFRHICTYLLWYCVQGDCTDLLHEVIRCIGHFTLDNEANQDLVHSGAQPTVLQQLCSLPFAYFSSPPLMRVLLPTLIACCHDNERNIAILEQESSCSMLEDFIQSFLNNGEGKGDQKTTNNQKDAPRSLADIPQFDSRFLDRALNFFSSNGATVERTILS